MKNETEAIITYKTKVYKLTTTDGYTSEDLLYTLNEDALRLIYTRDSKHYGIIKIDTSCIQEKSNTLKATLKANTNMPISGVEFDCKVVVDNYYFETFTITTTEEFSLDIPIGKYLKKAENELEIQLSLKNLYGEETLIGYFSLEAEYTEETSKKHITQTAQLVGGAEEIVDLFTGDSVTRIIDTADENIGIEISHILKRSEDDFCCGEDARLNIHEKLVKNEDTDLSAEYVYTDDLGNTHYLKETFYYIDSTGTKQDITDKTAITVLSNGKLEYIDPETSTHFEVYRKEATFCGLKAVTNLDNVKNIKYFEQRQQELKDLEQQTNAYHKTLLDYVLVNGIDEELSFDNLEEFVSNVDTPEYKCYTRAEKLNLDSISNQIAIVLKQENFNNELKEKYKNQSDDIGTQLESIDKQIEELKSNSLKNFENIIFLQNTSSPENKTYYKELIGNYVVWNNEDVNTSFTVIENDDGIVVGITLNDLVLVFKDAGSDVDETYVQTCLNYLKSHIENNTILISTKDELTSLETLLNQQTSLQNSKSLIELQQEAITKDSKYETLNIQLSALEQQRLHIESSNDHNKENVISIYKDYLILLNNLNITKKQIPVNYIVSDEYTKGFNENGDLVVIYDKHNKYAVLEYEEYYSGADKLNRISRILNEKEQFIQFVYDHNNLLIKIIDSMGRITSFEYSTSSPFIISKIIYPNEEFIALTQWSKYKKTISTKYEYSVISSSYLNGVTSITNSSTIEKVAHNDITVGGDKQMSKLIFTYDYKKTTVLDNMQNGVVYSFDDSLNVIEGIKIEKGLIVSAIKRSYDNKGRCINEEYPKKSCLNVTLDEFNFEMDYTANYEYDEFDNLKAKSVGIVTISDTLGKITSTEYFYDNNNRIIKTKSSVYERIDGVLDFYPHEILFFLFEYNSNGLLIKKQSYTEGEETTNGVNVEEYVYNDNGYLTSTITYNSLDPSSKYYSEQEIDENGQIIADIDACGMNKTSYYGNTIVYPNGGKFSYGYDSKNGNSTITQSTKDGEENSIQRQYTNGLLTRVISSDDIYDYVYDFKGRVNEVKLNGNTLTIYNYNEYENEGLPCLETCVGYNNHFGIDTAHTSNKTYSSIYDVGHGMFENVSYEKGNPVAIEKTINGTIHTTTYSYNEQGNLTNVHRTTSPNLPAKYDEIYQYNENGKLAEKTIKLGSNISQIYQFEYSEKTKKQLEKIKIIGYTENAVSIPFDINLTTDTLGRKTGKSIVLNNNTLLSENISYLKHGDHTTNLPQAISYGSNQIIKYKYDIMGNICEIRENDRLISRYTYDSLNRLAREDNKALNQTVVFEYDNKGNILSRVKYPFTLKDSSYLDEIDEADIQRVGYAYENGKLVSYNGGSFEYDEIGNPTLYKENTLTWSYGRRLASYGANTFEYDFDGSRIRKNNTVYIYDNDGRLIRQGNSNSNNFINFIYDESGVTSFIYNHFPYFFKKDILGNVIEILDFEGNTVVKYVYDAWGNHKVLNADGTENTDATFVGNINPIRYRSYYYDTETGLYYLQSRYYDPEVGRFISMDDINYLDPETIGGTNLYAYCLNNPVKYIDLTGNFPWLALLIFAGVLIVGGGAIGGFSAATVGEISSDIWTDVGKGMLSGTIVFTGLSLTIGAFFVPNRIFGTLGSFMFSFGSGLILDTTSVIIAQIKKSSMDGDSFWGGAHDVINSIYSNLLSIVLGKQNILGLNVTGTKIVDLVGLGYGVFPSIYEMLQSFGYKKAITIGISEYFSGKLLPLDTVIAATSFVKSIYKFTKGLFLNPNETEWILH